MINLTTAVTSRLIATIFERSNSVTGYTVTHTSANLAAVVIDSAGTTAPEWLSRELRISYSGSPTLAAGDYEDQLIITISAK